MTTLFAVIFFKLLIFI